MDHLVEVSAYSTDEYTTASRYRPPGSDWWRRLNHRDEWTTSRYNPR